MVIKCDLLLTTFPILNYQVAIVILAIVAVAAADWYGAAPAYKAAAYSAPATYSAPAYKQEYAYVS